jgi:hypothetical protein
MICFIPNCCIHRPNLQVCAELVNKVFREGCYHDAIARGQA